MIRPATRAAAIAAWRAEGLGILSALRLELSAVEALLRAGTPNREFAIALERAWDTSGQLSRMACGPEVSLEQLEATEPVRNG